MGANGNSLHGQVFGARFLLYFLNLLNFLNFLSRIESEPSGYVSALLPGECGVSRGAAPFGDQRTDLGGLGR